MASDADAPARQEGTLDLVRHMLNVIQNQQTQIAELRHQNEQLRAKLSGAPARASPEVAAEQQRSLAENAQATDDALATLINLAAAHPPLQALAAQLPNKGTASGTKRKAQDSGQARPPPPPPQPVQQPPANTARVTATPAQLAGSERAAPSENGGGPAHADADPAPDESRCCTSCGTTNTPKWRNNNTLCNACGLRAAKQSSAAKQPLQQQPQGSATAPPQAPQQHMTIGQTMPAPNGTMQPGMVKQYSREPTSVVVPNGMYSVAPPMAPNPHGMHSTDVHASSGLHMLSDATRPPTAMPVATMVAPMAMHVGMTQHHLQDGSIIMHHPPPPAGSLPRDGSLVSEVTVVVTESAVPQPHYAPMGAVEQ